MFVLFMAGKTLKKWQIPVRRTKEETYPEIIISQKMPFPSAIRLDNKLFLMAKAPSREGCKNHGGHFFAPEKKKALQLLSLCA